MNKMMKIGLTTLALAVSMMGCMSAKSLATAKSTSEKWETFKSIKVVPYTNMGLPKIDRIGNTLCQLSDVYVKGVVVPMIEADKEGYTGVVAQFVEDVAAAKKDGKSEADVYQAWLERYGKENVAKLPVAFATVEQLRTGKKALLALAIAKLPEFAAIAKEMPDAIKEVKASAKNPMAAAKLVGTATQVGQRIDTLIWSVNFLKILSEDKAAETAALKKYVESIQSKVN